MSDTTSPPTLDHVRPLTFLFADDGLIPNNPALRPILADDRVLVTPAGDADKNPLNFFSNCFLKSLGHECLKEILAHHIRRGDLILLKGSRYMSLEKLVAPLSVIDARRVAS